MHYNQQVGKFGEQVAITYLVKKGYRIIESNLKLSYKEIDIIALKGDILVFFEVKTRTSRALGGASEALTSKKINRIKIAAGHYLRAFKGVSYSKVRLDFLSLDIIKEKKVVKVKHFSDIV